MGIGGFPDYLRPAALLVISGRKAGASYQILPARIAAQTVEHRHRQFDDAENVLPIRLLKMFEAGCQIAKADVDHCEVER